jgi:Rrf2 family protein
MFGFTKKTDYALIALAGLADLPARGEGRLSARQISERYGMPLPVLMGVLKSLVGGGLVRSTRGARGGYSLARNPAGISVNDVVSAIEGPVSVTICCDSPAHSAAGRAAASASGRPTSAAVASPEPENGTTDCHIEVRCPISHSVRNLNLQIRDYLSRVTLADLMGNRVNPIEPAGPAVHDLKFRPLPEESR